MSWTSQYEAKRRTADEALAVVRSGDRVYIHPGCANPVELVQALTRRAPTLRDVEIMILLMCGPTPYVAPELGDSFRVNALFMGGNVRGAVSDGRADYTPIFLHEIERMFELEARPDVVLMQVTPPDKHGFVNLGIGVDCTLGAARAARHVIAEINPNMPRTLGECHLHLTDIDAIVEVNHPLCELAVEPPNDVQQRIGAHVAGLVPDGATLQMGIGGVPNAVLSCLINHKDLGIHTELFSDGVIPLVEKGVMNGARKTLHPGKLVAGFVLGTRNLFDFVEEDPLFEFRPIRYVNDPFVVAQNDNMVAINSALQVDLTGQVCSDSIGTSPYSGFGGQVDYIRGAARSKGGRPIIALPATARNGTVSRIAPMLHPGAGVVTSRADVHYVVTEFGIAYLHGKSLRQRAEALIRIAHPDFHQELSDFAHRAHKLKPKTIVTGGLPEPEKPATGGPPMTVATDRMDRGQVSIAPEICKGCGLCVEACARDLLRLASHLNSFGYHPAEYVGHGCTGCSLCFYACPEPDAITVYKLQAAT
jgi:acyl-CoA hydrolase/NAD-dependent dihydropyrimidine dehydrogenase PreA subunit